jgi:DNA-binding CsgD family transcriptional regulator
MMDWAIPELVEAAARTGRPELVRPSLERLSERAQSSGTDLAMGLRAYSLALQPEGRDAEDLAREQLRTAHQMFVSMGAKAFADRAARELVATGGRAPKPRVETGGRLTAQETQIARFAHEGLTNQEIGARLFLSPRTVEYHLHKVFTKLSIGSRTELGDVLPGIVANGAHWERRRP